ncbi:hypothetical protein AX16_004636 [Volvariella volvacea WC 439]|nr:hypothetical protein AX16_004636 [Volvariella volvacea WC 439]
MHRKKPALKSAQPSTTKQPHLPSPPSSSFSPPPVSKLTPTNTTEQPEVAPCPPSPPAASTSMAIAISTTTPTPLSIPPADPILTTATVALHVHGPSDTVADAITTDFTTGTIDNTLPINLPKCGVDHVDIEAAPKTAKTNFVDKPQTSSPTTVKKTGETQKDGAASTAKPPNMTTLKKLCKQEWMTENPSKRVKDFEAHWAGLTPKVCKANSIAIWKARGEMFS